MPAGSGDSDPGTHAFIQYGVSRDGRFCVSAQVDADYPVVVGLHRGADGQKGDVVAHLYGPTDERDYYTCTELGPELGRDVAKHPVTPTSTYTNPEYPCGALRSQVRS